MEKTNEKKNNNNSSYNIHDNNNLNNLSSKEWLIGTRSVWRYSDYDFNDDIEQGYRHFKKLILFFTKKGQLVLNPDNDEIINEIAKREEREVIHHIANNIDFILLKEDNNFLDYSSYKRKLSNEIKKKYYKFYEILKEKQYLCVIVRDFYFDKINSELILFHNDLANIITKIGFALKGITIWMPKDIKTSDKLKSAIQHDIILIFRKDPEKKVERNSIEINFPEVKKLKEGIIAFQSYLLSVPPPRDKFKAQHPATFPEPDVMKLIENYTTLENKPRVLDPFCGVGSTLLACQELKVRGYGIELTKKWIDLTIKRFHLNNLAIRVDKEVFKPPTRFSTTLTDFTSSKKKEKMILQNLISGDSNIKIRLFKDNFFDFIITSPPYWGILTKKIDHKMKAERVDKGLDTKYTEEDVDDTYDKDLGNVESYEDFLKLLKSIFQGCFEKLKSSSYMVVIVSDFRNKSKFYLYHCDIALILKKVGFKLTGLTVLHQDSKNLYPYGYPFVFVSNIHHQFMITVKKEL
ncbi:MAG: DNA methyltransferase [Promethearchaeota archaeon]